MSESDMRAGVRSAEQALQKSMDDAIRDAERAPFNPTPGQASGKHGDPRDPKSMPASPRNMTRR